jgi:mono/diheme cytochrome c family protein
MGIHGSNNEKVSQFCNKKVKATDQLLIFDPDLGLLWTEQSKIGLSVHKKCRSFPSKNPIDWARRLKERNLMKVYSYFPSLVAMVLVMAQLSIAAMGAEKKTLDPRRVMPLFRRHCALCHGSDGKGDTEGGKKAGAKDYSNPEVAKKLKDTKKIVAIVLKGLKSEEGKMLMAPFNRKLKDYETEALIKYMQKFSAVKKK